MKKKKLLALLMAATMFVSGIPVNVSAASAKETAAQLYVSLDGSDSAAGTLEDPFASLEAARDRIRDMKNNGGLPSGGVVVNIREGEYPYLEDSFALEEQDSGTADSPIIYRAYNGEEVNLVGNMIVEGRKFAPVEDQAVLDRLSDDVEKKVLVYDLAKENGLTKFAPIPKNGFGWPAQASAMSVLVDGEAQTLARYPNEGFVNISSIQQKGFVPRDHQLNPDGTCPACTKEAGGTERIACAYGEEKFLEQPGGVFTVNGLRDKYALWNQETDIWTAGYFFWDWADDNCAIKTVEDTGSGLKMTMRHPSRYGVGQGGRKFYAYNLLCEIDQPGEWYLDRDNAKLYLYPSKELAGSSVELAIQTKPLVCMDSADYVDWQGVTFSKSNGHGLVMKDCENVEVAGCTFSDLGQRAVFIGDPNGADVNNGNHGGSNNTVRSCDITRTGQGGVYVGGGERYSLTKGNNKVINCDISDFATIKRTYSPAVELVGCGNSAERNHIYDAPHTAIQFSGNDMWIYGNDIHNVCYETADVGAVYSVRRWSWQGTVVKNNFIHDLVNTGGLGSAAVYVDDLGSGVTMTENLLVNIPGYTTLFGGGRDNVITNNIQINPGNGKGFHYDNRGLGWAWYHAAGPDGECYGELASLRANPQYDKKLWDERYPGLAAIDLDTVQIRTDKGDGYKNWYKVAARPANAEIEKNILVGVANPFGNVNNDVKTYGHFDSATNIALAKGTDIGFANAEAYDFSVLENSKIKEMMGDDHFKVEEMGLYEDEFRTLNKTVLENPVLTAPQDEEQDVVVTNGVRFSWKAVENAGTYKLEIAEDEAFTNVVKTYSSDDTTFAVPGLEKNTTYYWRVTAREKAVNGAFSVSEVRSFTTSDKDDPSFFEGFRDFKNMAPLVENGTQKGNPSNTTDIAHSGRYSYELNESMDVITKVFGTKHNDVAGVWLYDNMNKQNGASAIANVTQVGGAWVGAGVAVATNGAHKDNYVVRIGGSWIDTPLVRTEGWHELKWDYSEAGTCKIYIDDTLVYTLNNAPYYDCITMGDWWGHGGYPGDVSGMAFDDLRAGDPQVKENILSITLPETDITINMDETYQLEPVVETDPDIDAELAYSAQEWEVAKVDENGLIQPMRKGKTIVTVESKNNPEIRTTVNVTVTNHIDKSGLETLYNELMGYAKPDYTPESWKVLADALVQGYQVLKDEDADFEEVNAAVQALKDAKSGLVMTEKPAVIENGGFESGTSEGFKLYPTNGDGQGRVTVTDQTAYSGKYSAQMQFNCQVPWDGAKGYKIMGLMATIPGTEVAEGAQYDVSFLVKSADGKTHNIGTNVTFRNGKGGGLSDWTAVGEEWVRITYRTPSAPAGLDRLEIVMGNENTTASAGKYYIDDVVITKVTPGVHVKSVALDQTEVTVFKGKEVQLNAAVTPDNATNDTLYWSSSDNSVASVKDGVVTAKEAGTAVITVTALDGEFTAECTVNVQEKSTYTVVVENGTGSGEYAYNEKVTAVAEETKDGNEFAGWRMDGHIVSLDRTYTFYASNDVTVTAVYEAVEQKAEALATNVVAEKRDDGKYNVKFVGQIILPEGYTIKEAGLVWSSNEEGILEVNGAGSRTTYIARISNTNQFSVTVKGMPAGNFLRGKIFAKVTDQDGNEKVIYSTEERAVTKTEVK